MLAHRYRFTVKNETGQTIAANSIFVYARRYKFDQNGAKVDESSEATVLTNSSTLANGAFLSGSTQDNTSALWLGGYFAFVVTAPASSNGNVILYYDATTDNADNRYPSSGLGVVVAVLNFTASGTKQVSFEL
ncbi:MAG: hypothetical protein QXD59_02035 [Candidatus Caldarchaeum sp.]